MNLLLEEVAQRARTPSLARLAAIRQDDPLDPATMIGAQTSEEQPNKMRIFQEEIFGPVLAVTTFRDEAEALAIASDSPYGLGAGVCSRDANRCHHKLMLDHYQQTKNLLVSHSQQKLGLF